MRDQNQMISNERPSPYRQPYRKPNRPYPGQQPYDYQQQPRPQIQEDTLKTCDLEVERKSFRLALKENSRGRFLRVTESNGNKFNSIVVPASGLADFQQMINEMVTAADNTSIAIEPEPTHQPLEESASRQVDIEKSAVPEPEPVLVKEARTRTPKASTKTKTVRKRVKAANETAS